MFTTTKPERYNSLNPYVIARICREHGIEPGWSGDRIYADLPAFFNGKMHMKSAELTNMTKRELLEEIGY